MDRVQNDLPDTNGHLNQIRRDANLLYKSVKLHKNFSFFFQIWNEFLRESNTSILWTKLSSSRAKLSVHLPQKVIENISIESIENIPERVFFAVADERLNVGQNSQGQWESLSRLWTRYLRYKLIIKEMIGLGLPHYYIIIIVWYGICTTVTAGTSRDRISFVIFLDNSIQVIQTYRWCVKYIFSFFPHSLLLIYALSQCSRRH